jgi:predicted nucleic acid-binding protein
MVIEGDRTLQVQLRQAARLVTSALTLVEADRGVRRALADGRLTAQEYRKVSKWLSAFAKTCEVIALDESVLHRAQQTFLQEPVRTLDALHLASAQAWADGVEPVAMVSHDTRVRENARAWGYTVLP